MALDPFFRRMLMQSYQLFRIYWHAEQFLPRQMGIMSDIVPSLRIFCHKDRFIATSAITMTIPTEHGVYFYDDHGLMLQVSAEGVDLGIAEAQNAT
jgi:hypothetical protein